MEIALADFVLVSGFVLVGLWLEGVGGKSGFMDRLLAPLPLGAIGLVAVFLEHRIA